jgi:hypothetical protein
MYRKSVKRGAVVFLLLIIIVTILAISASNISAFGLSTPYIKDETLNVNAGKTYEYGITLQNSDSEGYYVDIAYASTEDVASLESTEYYVQSETYNTTFYFTIKIPVDAPVGKTYALEYAAKPRVNESGGVAMGVEIKRGITILVIDGTTNAVKETTEKEITLVQEDNTKSNSLKNISKYILLVIILAIVILIARRLWRLSKGLSSKIGEVRQAKYTISEAISLAEVKKLLQNISDEEFEVSEIKNIFKDKLSELTTNDIAHKMFEMSRKEVIRAIDKIKE